jgi:hypothetical protein
LVRGDLWEYAVLKRRGFITALRLEDSDRDRVREVAGWVVACSRVEAWVVVALAAVAECSEFQVTDVFRMGRKESTA